ncbi:hypothetical protein LptCag_0670 [Leptospirillum ferriphilum]|uniref:Uncharacterized protein n=1 Tax=Leptospirillum ferriphilum TaxID=178606 RepID=A0A094X695_9BACT|nr:hypothetical protein LptCag_0670 [Leptospirillum ferriphilum]
MICEIPWTRVHSGGSRTISLTTYPMTGVTGTRSIENLFTLGNDRRRHGERGLHGFCCGDLVCRNPRFQNIELCRIGCRRQQAQRYRTQYCSCPFVHNRSSRKTVVGV